MNKEVKEVILEKEDFDKLITFSFLPFETVQAAIGVIVEDSFIILDSYLIGKGLPGEWSLNLEGNHLRIATSACQNEDHLPELISQYRSQAEINEVALKFIKKWMDRCTSLWPTTRLFNNPDFPPSLIIIHNHFPTKPESLSENERSLMESAYDLFGSGEGFYKWLRRQYSGIDLSDCDIETISALSTNKIGLLVLGKKVEELYHQKIKPDEILKGFQIVESGTVKELPILLSKKLEDIITNPEVVLVLQIMKAVAALSRITTQIGV